MPHRVNRSARQWPHTGCAAKCRSMSPSASAPLTFADSAARNYSNKVPQINQVKWTSPISSKMVLDVSGSSMRVNDRFDPRPEVPDGAIARFGQAEEVSCPANTLLTALIHARENGTRV